MRSTIEHAFCSCIGFAGVLTKLLLLLAPLAREDRSSDKVTTVRDGSTIAVF